MSRHTSDNPDWRSPAWLPALAHRLMGSIDLDPMSDLEANVSVKATRIFTAQDRTFERPWEGRVFLNPAGGYVRQAWQYLVKQVLTGACSEAIWVGFSVEQLQTLQVGEDSDVVPLDFPVCYPRQRIAFVESPEMTAARKDRHEIKQADRALRGEMPTKFNPRSSPTHAGYVAYLGINTTGFYRAFLEKGVVVCPLSEYKTKMRAKLAAAEAEGVRLWQALVDVRAHLTPTPELDGVSLEIIDAALEPKP